MSGECDRCGHHCMDCVCNAPDCTSRALEILSQIDADLWRGYTTQEKKAAEDEIARLTSEVTQFRADLANAGAVMVEACAQAIESDGEYVRAIGLAKRIRALSTLSPIAAAARVLLAAGPHGPLAPLYDAVRQRTGALPGSDEEDEIIDGVDEGLRALAEQDANPPTEYERKVAQMKKDFPNGI